MVKHDLYPQTTDFLESLKVKGTQHQYLITISERLNQLENEVSYLKEDLEYATEMVYRMYGEFGQDK